MDRILYVIGAPQHLHLQMMFAMAPEAGWPPDDVEPVHVQIGNVLGGACGAGCASAVALADHQGPVS